jgi:hypothetical protein
MRHPIKIYDRILDLVKGSERVDVDEELIATLRRKIKLSHESGESARMFLFLFRGD